MAQAQRSKVVLRREAIRLLETGFPMSVIRKRLKISYILLFELVADQKLSFLPFDQRTPNKHKGKRTG